MQLYRVIVNKNNMNKAPQRESDTPKHETSGHLDFRINHISNGLEWKLQYTEQFWAVEDESTQLCSAL